MKRGVRIAFVVWAIVGGVVTCSAQTPIPITAVKLLPPEPGSLAEALKLIQSTVSYNFENKANTVTAVVQFSKNGKPLEERFYTDDKIRLPPDSRSDLGSLTMTILDLDKHPAVATKPGQQMLHIRQQLGGKTATQSFVLPKEKFDLTGKGQLRTFTEPSSNLYYWLKGDIKENEEIKNLDDLRKKYPEGDYMLISVYSLG